MGARDFKELKESIAKQIKKSSNVFIIGHNEPDFDSIGSAIGLQVLASSMGKQSYIIVNDEEAKIESGVKKIIDENRYKYNIIKKRDFEELKNKQSLVIITDVNKDYMVCISDELDTIGNTIIIDHHSQDEHTIKTNYKWIDQSSSSACEIVSRLLGSYHTSYSKDVANFLLAGISLDTKRFKQNTTSRTHDVAEKLIRRGADIDYVNKLFMEDIDVALQVNSITFNGTLIKKYTESMSPIQISFSLNRNNPKEIYNKIIIAKAADKMMKFNGIDASFALGYVDNENIHISGRSNKRVDVGKIMEAMNGGGNHHSAAALIKSNDIFEIEKELNANIIMGLMESEIILEEPQIIKILKLR